MKTTLAAIALALVPITAPAQSADEVFGVFSEFGQAVMTARQNGVPLQVAMSANDTNSELLAAIILQAYEVPRYSTERVKRRAIEDFRDEVSLGCYQAFAMEQGL